MPTSPDYSTSINISSNTLFHFTNSIDNLLNILTNDFFPHHCLEYSAFVDYANIPDPLPNRVIPMVSFCDLPLSFVKSHLEFYGFYGIGLKKNWGINKEISPVFYVHQNSPFQRGIKSLLSIWADVPGEAIDKEVGVRVIDYISGVLHYAKLYEGPAWRDGKRLDNVRFYNEREWRFVPKDYPHVFVRASDNVNSPEFRTKLRNANKGLAEKATISFGPDDIQYIIIKSEDEILDMITQIEKIKGKFSWQQVRRLITTITTSERVKQDF